MAGLVEPKLQTPKLLLTIVFHSEFCAYADQYRVSFSNETEYFRHFRPSRNWNGVPRNFHSKTFIRCKKSSSTLLSAFAFLEQFFSFPISF
jgi:hypothetical protein